MASRDRDRSRGSSRHASSRGRGCRARPGPRPSRSRSACGRRRRSHGKAGRARRWVGVSRRRAQSSLRGRYRPRTETTTRSSGSSASQAHTARLDDDCAGTRGRRRSRCRTTGSRARPRTSRWLASTDAARAGSRSIIGTEDSSRFDRRAYVCIHSIASVAGRTPTRAGRRRSGHADRRAAHLIPHGQPGPLRRGDPRARRGAGRRRSWPASGRPRGIPVAIVTARSS